MRAWLSALLKLLRQALAQTGWRQHQEGEGTQIGQVHGNVTIYQQAAPISAATPDHAPQSAPHAARPTPQPRVRDVLDLLDELRACEEKRLAVLDWMQQNLGTAMVKDLDEGQLRRAYGYALAARDDFLQERERAAQLARAYRDRRRRRS